MVMATLFALKNLTSQTLLMIAWNYMQYNKLFGCCIVKFVLWLQSRFKLEKVHTIYKRLIEIQDVDPTLVS